MAVIGLIGLVAVIGEIESRRPQIRIVEYDPRASANLYGQRLTDSPSVVVCLDLAEAASGRVCCIAVTVYRGLVDSGSESAEPDDSAGIRVEVHVALQIERAVFRHRLHWRSEGT